MDADQNRKVVNHDLESINTTLCKQFFKQRINQPIN